MCKLCDKIRTRSVLLKIQCSNYALLDINFCLLVFRSDYKLNFDNSDGWARDSSESISLLA